jgi:uncharacterized protein YyaL (SSP411 family)
MSLRLTLASLLVIGCTARVPSAAPTSETAPRGMVRKGTPAGVDIVKARANSREQLFAWDSWSPDAFARAKREKRHILVHGAAEWCHWCHVMEETTYRDPRVGQILRDKFVAIRVDIDSRPDIADRYGDWGWPATILLGPDAEELGKFRGYLPADEMLANLAALEGARPIASEDSVLPRSRPAPAEALAWIGAESARDLDEYYDDKEGGWGVRQKAPLGDAVSFELRRAAHGDELALRRAMFTLEKQAVLIDPVWGGIYQYSAAGDWNEPHYEKLMSFQAENLTAYARAYAITKDQATLKRARDIARYLDTFLSNREGAFLVSQDADVGSHDQRASFIDGDVYFRLDDAARRKLGIPRIDDHVYGDTNGMAIAALASLFEATGDASVRDRAERAAKLLLRTHVDADGRVAHDPGATRKVYFLSDAAHLGYGLARLAEVSKDPALRDAAHRIAEGIVRDLTAEDGALWAHTADPDAVGVFARRRKPFPENSTAARLFAAIGRLTADHAWHTRARQTLAAIASPHAIRDQGRMIGTFLLALDEAGALAW